MSCEKRKAAQREAQRRIRARKKREGRVNFTWLIKPEWRRAITMFVKQLESGAKSEKSKETV